MGIIICPECGKEISNTTNQCIYCGFELKKIKNKEKENNSSKFRVFLYMIVSIIIGINIFIIYNHFYITSEQENYERILKIESMISDSTNKCGEMMDEISSTWSLSIENDKDFNNELSNLINNNWASSNKIQLRTNEKIEIEKEIVGLKNMKNQSIYIQLKELYYVYEKICSLATTPSGSLMQYNMECNKVISDYQEKLSRLRIELESGRNEVE